MELHLLPILNDEGRRLMIDETLTIENRDGDNFQILEPIAVSGQMVNIGGSLELMAKGEAKVRLLCDRCAEEFSDSVFFEMQERFKKEESDGVKETNPDIVLLEGDTIDLDALVYDAIVMHLPSKVLCNEDCKGLCPSCGTNLNYGDCGCDTESTDPRFDILDKLL